MSGAEVIYGPGEPHRCDLPNRPLAETVVRCAECGTYYVAKWDDDSWGSPNWHPVRWYHRRARRWIRAYEIARTLR